MHLVSLSRIVAIGFAFYLSISVVQSQECTEWPEDKKLQRLFEKIESEDDPIEKDVLFREALVLSERALSVQIQYNSFLIGELNARNELFAKKGATIAEQTKQLDKQCELNTIQSVFLMDVLFGQRLFDEFLERFDGNRFEEDSLQLLEKQMIAEAKVWQKLLSEPLVEKKKLALVSSDASEYLPFLSTDGRFMFFTRKQTVRQKGSVVSQEQELFMRANFTPEGHVLDVLEMPKPFNYGEGNYGGFTSSLSGDKMFLTVCNALENGYRNCDIFQIIENLDTAGKSLYSAFERLPNTINTDSTWESQPALSIDGNTLYFAKYPGEIGGIDIYYSTKNDSGQWSVSKPIEGDVNTSYNEKAPFVHADNKHMYFSSDQYYTLGSYDLFYAEAKGAGWVNVQNLSSAINTEGDEHGIQIDADGKTAYISSNIGNRMGTFDIYQFILPKAYQSEYRKVVSGQLNYLPKDGFLMKLISESGNEIAELKPKESNRRFAAVLTEEQANQNLLLTTESKGSKPFFNGTRIESNQSGQVDINTEAIQDKTKGFTLENVLFGTDDAIVNPKSMLVLKAFSTYLKSIEFNKVNLIGHTDDQGDSVYNLELSAKRAKAVGDILQQFGIAANKINCEGKGDALPLFSNDTEINRAKNRRTEVQIEQ